MDHETYRIDSEVIFNNILQKNDIMLAPLRKGNFMMLIASFIDEKELLEIISFDRPKFMIGDEVQYKNNDFNITRFDDIEKGLTTVTIKVNTEFLVGMITGSEVIAYRQDSDLDGLFGLEEKTKISEKTKASNFKITKETLPKKLSPSERLNNNLEAISILNRIEKGERNLILQLRKF